MCVCVCGGGGVSTGWGWWEGGGAQRGCAEHFRSGVQYETTSREAAGVCMFTTIGM